MFAYLMGSGTDHHSISKIDSDVALPDGIIRSFKENEVSGLCFCFGNVLAFLP